MSSQIGNVVEIVKDEEFLYATLKRENVRVIRKIMDREVIVEIGYVRSFTNFYIKINDCYYIRNENKFLIESVK